ncbi:MAG TPA: hypothetical protein PKY77_03090 [Phycisphaerae bacterium]|nr:hypothetical protein [Phycisphaerae bacterium]HRY67416.1 hypothetical protein [Phycisphaerae bacterium]HSA28993.1 hypothetical protein [Phycisphaerae bacterium]
MSRRNGLGRFSITLLAIVGGCETSLQEQVATLAKDFFLEALAAYLL